MTYFSFFFSNSFSFFISLLPPLPPFLHPLPTLALSCKGLRQSQAYTIILGVLEMYKYDVNVQTAGLLALSNIIKDGEPIHSCTCTGNCLDVLNGPLRYGEDPYPINPSIHLHIFPINISVPWGIRSLYAYIYVHAQLQPFLLGPMYVIMLM